MQRLESKAGVAMAPLKITDRGSVAVAVCNGGAVKVDGGNKGVDCGQKKGLPWILESWRRHTPPFSGRVIIVGGTQICE